MNGQTFSQSPRKRGKTYTHIYGLFNQVPGYEIMYDVRELIETLHAQSKGHPHQSPGAEERRRRRARRSSFEGQERAVVSQTTIGTV